MKVGIGFIKVDYYAQLILGLSYLLTGLAGIIIPGLWLLTIIIQFFLGVWQVLSGFSLALANQDKERFLYLVFVVLYLVLIFGGATLGNYVSLPRGFGEGFAIFALFAIPIGLGVWYFIITKREYIMLCDKPLNAPGINLKMDDILDSDELLKN